MYSKRTVNKLSRRTFLLQAGQFAALGLATAPASTAYRYSHSAETLQPINRSLPSDIPPMSDQIRPQLAARPPSLEYKIGQMLLVGFNGTQVTDESPIVQDIRQHNLGGVVLFGRNVQSIDQVRSLTEKLQSSAEIPLIISTDQEGGNVRRLGYQFGLKRNLSAHQLGLLNDLTTTRQYVEDIAQTLSTLGINLNLAPVVDLNTNPLNPVIGRVGRSFSADPDIVTQQALTFIRTHRHKGTLCTLKHFPGHGSSTHDSHLGFVDVTQTWSEKELEPFARIIRTGECDAVMTAHIFNAELDAHLPATLSEEIITGILRRRLGYDGVVITDDMLMGAIRRHYRYETAVQFALKAGVDMFAIARYSWGIVNRTIRIIHDMVKAGTIEASRIDESYQRIMALKAKFAIAEPKVQDETRIARPDVKFQPQFRP